MTVGQLAEVAGLSIDEVVSLVLTKAALRRSRGGPRASKTAPRSQQAPAAGTIVMDAASSGGAAPSQHNTRTREGRESLDAAILGYLGSAPSPVAATDIREAVGGTAAQVRARLNHLIEETGEVAYDGRASGTRYWSKK
jgi:hypothetical protein